MIEDIIITILWSLSPFGEAKVGIPFGMANGLNIYLVFILAFLANVLIFPIMMFFLDRVNIHLVQWNWYKRSALWIARRAKGGSGDKIQKHGFLGLMLFVMIPLPGTGVYAGSIATFLFKMERKKAFAANTIGIFFSSLIIWLTTLATVTGIA